MNSNLFHNLVSLALLILGALIQFDWTSLGLSADDAAKLAGILVMASSGLKFIVNLNRDGLAGLTKPQPPVKAEPGP